MSAFGTRHHLMMSCKYINLYFSQDISRVCSSKCFEMQSLLSIYIFPNSALPPTRDHFCIKQMRQVTRYLQVMTLRASCNRKKENKNKKNLTKSYVSFVLVEETMGAAYYLLLNAEDYQDDVSSSVLSHVTNSCCAIIDLKLLCENDLLEA